MNRKYINFLVLSLAFLSGICGLAYELLFSRVLTVYLGDMYYVNAAILISFFLGLTVAAFVSYRFLKWLWLVEIGIGVYALVFSFVWNQFGFLISSHLMDATAMLQFQSVFICFLLIFPAAFLIGMCVPVYTHYLEEIRQESDESQSFEWTYVLYNLGAAVCVLFVEFWLIRIGGIKFAIQWIAFLNIMIGFILKNLSAQLNDAPLVRVTFKNLTQDIKKDFLILFVISVISGISQLVYLKYIYLFWGPNQENFAIHLAVVLTGISAGTFLVNKYRIRMPMLILAAPILLMFSFMIIGPILDMWAASGKKFMDPGSFRTIKGVFIFSMLIIPMLVFGALIPSMHRQMEAFKNRTGGILAVSSLGNCLGFALTIFFLFEHIPYRKMAFFISAGIIILSLLAYSVKRKLRIITGLFSCVMFVVLIIFLPSKIFYLGGNIIGNPSYYQYFLDQIQSHESYRKYDQSVNILNFENSGKMLIINGYRSLAVNKDRVAVSEFLYGVGEAMFSEKREKALVIGIGTGVTTAAVSYLYKDVTAVEINPMIIEVLPRFKEHNFDIVNRPNLNIVNDDGMSFLTRDQEKYDLIMNNVSSPLLNTAGKIWTKEAMELAKSHLAPGGVYSLWVSPSRGQKQIEIILNTVASTFKHCHLFMMEQEYGMLICSDESIRPQNLDAIQWPDLIVTALKYFGKPMNEIMSYSAFDVEIRTEHHQEKKIHTVDFPALDFALTPIIYNRFPMQSELSILDLLDIDIGRSAFTGALLTEKELTKRCQFLFSEEELFRKESIVDICRDKIEEENNAYSFTP